MKKKLLAIALSMTMAFACMTACGESASTSDSSRAENSSKAETTTYAADGSSQTEITTMAAEITTTSTASETTETSETATTSDTVTTDETTDSESLAASETTTTTTTSQTTTTSTDAKPAITTTSAASRKTTSKATTASTSRPAAQTTTTTAQKQEPEPLNLPYSKAAVLYCADSGEYVYKHNINSRISIASTTKLLTASLAVKYLGKDKVITVGSEIWLTKPYSTVAGLRSGQRLTTEQLLYGLLLPSGNDAAYTVAVNVARVANPQKTLTNSQAVSIFVSMMNSFASQLGMTSGHFANPEGWDNALHYSTLSDMMILTRHALSQPLIARIVSTHSKSVQLVSGGYMTWTNTNRLLDPTDAFYVSTAVGVKTGFTQNAGYCVIAAVRRGGKTYYCAAMGCSTPDSRYTVVRRLLSYYLK